MSHTAAWPNEDFSIAFVVIHPTCKACQVGSAGFDSTNDGRPFGAGL